MIRLLSRASRIVLAAGIWIAWILTTKGNT